MNAHFFISDTDGALHDTRDSNWSAKPLRVNYRKHHRTIETVADFKACLRAGKTTDLGGYPLYFLCNDGNVISFEAAHKSFAIYAREIEHQERARITHCDINYEDNALFCDDSGEQIPSAYGDDDWSGSPDPVDPDNFWIDDETGERVNAATGERTRPEESSK